MKKDQKSEAQKAYDKIILNSDYRALGSQFFSFYDDVKILEITETGKKYLEELQKKSDNGTFM